jgi:integrase
MHVNTVASKRSNNVTIYNKGGYLYLNFMLDGKRKRKALKMKDTLDNRKVVNSDIIPQLQKKILLGEYGQEKKQLKTFKYYSEFFLEDKRSLKTFLNKLPMYKKAIKFFENDNVKDINRLKIKQYISSINGTSETKADYLAVIKEILNYALDDEEIANNPAIGITIPKERRDTKINFFKKEEVQKLLNDKEDLELNRYLQIAFNTGARPEEIIALKITDLKNGFVYFDRVKTKGVIDQKMKTDGSKRAVPCNIDPNTLKSDENSFYLFPNIRDVESFRKRWRALLKRNDISHRGISNCRHTFATHLLRDGIVSINELSGLLGHARVSTTLNKYASVIDSADTQVANKLMNFGYHSVTQKNDKENLRFNKEA